MSKRLTDEEAQAMLDQLGEHFGQRVAPVSQFCAALIAWVDVMRDSGQSHVGDAWDQIRLTLYKSNLAYRLVYLGEPVRTEACPKHKGHWSGCQFKGELCECASGSNITGWLPPPEGAKPDLNPPIRLVVAVPAGGSDGETSGEETGT